MGLLPEGYKPQTQENDYMKFEDGDNKFRALMAPIIGYQCFVPNPQNQGKTMPCRRPQPFSQSEMQQLGVVAGKYDNGQLKCKEFWAMPVYNYQLRKIQILEITQPSVKEFITNCDQDPEWGDFTNYDLVVKRGKEGQRTKYTTIAKPPKEAHPAILELWSTMNCDLEKYWTNGHPLSKIQQSNQTPPKESAIVEDKPL